MTEKIRTWNSDSFRSFGRISDIGVDFNDAFDITCMITYANRQIESRSWGALHFNWVIVNNHIEFAAVILMLAIHAGTFKAFHIY